MRIWSLHPSLLDSKGLVALWRETLLAQSVLIDPSKGYSNHSQLIRFKACMDQVGAIGYYLHEVANEATRRGYRFDYSKIVRYVKCLEGTIRVTKGQLDYERKHLNNKLVTRDLSLYSITCKEIKLHPLFYLVDGPIESWEKI